LDLHLEGQPLRLNIKKKDKNMRQFKLILGAFAFLMASVVSASAINVGISATSYSFSGDGTETVNDGTDSNTNTGSQDADVTVGSVFVEGETDGGWVIGLEYIPVSAEFVSSSKTQTNITDADSSTESKTQKVEGDLDNHTTLYVDTPTYMGLYLSAGVMSVNVTSNESIGTGSTYDNDTIYGTKVGIGYKADVTGNMYIKLEAAYSDYETIEISATNTDNKVTGDLDATSAKLSIGYKF